MHFEIQNPTAAVYLVSAVAGVSIFGDSLLYSVLPIYAGQLGIPLAAVGIVLSINRWVRLVTNPLAARSFSQFGVFWPLLATMILSVITTFVYSRAWGWPFSLQPGSFGVFAGPIFAWEVSSLLWKLCCGLGVWHGHFSRPYQIRECLPLPGGQLLCGFMGLP